MTSSFFEIQLPRKSWLPLSKKTGMSAAQSPSSTGGSRNILTAVDFFCVVLVASPFHTTADGMSSFSLRTIIWNGSHCACVSLIMQKRAAAPTPSVVNEWTGETIGSPSFAS